MSAFLRDNFRATANRRYIASLSRPNKWSDRVWDWLGPAQEDRAFLVHSPFAYFPLLAFSATARLRKLSGAYLRGEEWF